MEPLQRLTRKQLEVLQRVESLTVLSRGVPLKQLAKVLRIRPPTALGHLVVLQSMGLVVRECGKSRISPRGAVCLKEYVRHHRVAETLFAEAGLSAEDACEAAREVDLALSHAVVEKVCESERHPVRCPHGQVIDPCRESGNHAASARRGG
jgi:Mn-dependent DtxR family transcriptional regulator